MIKICLYLNGKAIASIVHTHHDLYYSFTILEKFHFQTIFVLSNVFSFKTNYNFNFKENAACKILNCINVN